MLSDQDTILSSTERTGEINLNHVADTIRNQRSASMNEFEIVHESRTNTWHVVGAGIQRFVQMTNWKYVFNPIFPFPHPFHFHYMLVTYACLLS